MDATTKSHLPDRVFGLDFSGARQAGENMFLASLHAPFSARPKLAALENMGTAAGTTERGAVMGELVRRVTASGASGTALWGMDFPFALPIEIGGDAGLDAQLAELAGHPDALSFGRACVARCLERTGRMHVRRTTDLEARTPFDCYHYRIVHQTFHGMRDVLLPLRRNAHVAILPFDPVGQANVLVTEACPSSTLKRLGLPHQKYKQTSPGPLTRDRLAVRAKLYAALHDLVEIPPSLQRIISRNKGGDALDAVLAALGAVSGLRRYDEGSVRRHPRYRKEGLIFF